MSSYTEKKISLRLKVSNCSPFQKALITIYITFFPLHLISIGQKGCFSRVKPHATKQKVFYLKVNQTDTILRRTETKHRCSRLKFGNKKQTHFLRQPLDTKHLVAFKRASKVEMIIIRFRVIKVARALT